MDSFFSINAVQWPAMIATLLAAWLVASTRKRRRHWGFWVFVLSNLLWVIWGWHSQAYALITLQAGLFLMNLRGIEKSQQCDTSRTNDLPQPARITTDRGPE